MPKRITPSELQRIHDVLLRYPTGIGFARLLSELKESLSRRTLSRRLSQLEKAGRIKRRGEGKATLYLHEVAVASREPTRPAPTSEGRASGEIPAVTATAPDVASAIDLSRTGRDILEYVSRPPGSRRAVGYERRLLDKYVPNRTAYVPDKLKVHLHKIGKPIAADRAAGTFARDILSRFLIDLSWSSSRLEGNTYSRLDTQRLIEFGQAAEGKDAKETQMILNHKAAIEWLVEGGDDVSVSRFTILNLHALLSDNLMADPEASGKLRRRPVEIGSSVYTPPGVPQVIEECFNLIIAKAGEIGDPFERAFFLMVQIPYLQPFEDVNKRVSRLAANIPLIKHDLCPLSFVDVPERIYISGTLGVYEMTRMDLLRDVFVWAYERSCQRYVVVRDSVAEPDIFRMKYKNALTDVIGAVIREGKHATEEEIRRRAAPIVGQPDLDKFVDMAVREFGRLNDGNIARYKVRPGEYWSWFRAVHATD